MVEYGPIRSIQDDLVISPSMPRLAVRIDSRLIYLGDLEYIRRETSQVEEFVFIDPNGLGHVTQFLVIHFEGFLENQSGAYHYSTAPAIVIEGDTYIYDAFVVDIQEYINQQRDSVIARAADYVRQRSYTLAGPMIFQRFRRPVTKNLRNEFSIIYAYPVEPWTSDTIPDPPVQAAAKSKISSDNPTTWPPPSTALQSFSIVK